MIRIEISENVWPMREPFAISRGVQTEQCTLNVMLTDTASGTIGRGEACGLNYRGENIETMRAQLESIIPQLQTLKFNEDIQSLLPAGGARFALDAALWDLRAKITGQSAWVRAGVHPPRPVITAYTIGIRSIPEYEQTARRCSAYPLLKVKVNANAPMEAIQSVRRGAPHARIIVDPNQAWSVDQLKTYAPPLLDLGVVLLEQPIAVGEEDGLAGFNCPIPLCADELVNTRDDLPTAAKYFDIVNIKLDKSGGLTEALQLADAAEAFGLRLMVGCMAGSSLCMAPALVLAQRCDFVDLDGPLLHSTDWKDGLIYENGRIDPPASSFWG